MTTNYVQTFITVSPDSAAKVGTIPSREGTIASQQHALLTAQPYRFTSDELLFEVHAMRTGIDSADRDRERSAFFGRSQACLRTSPLVKQFGWGLHHDEAGKVAAFGVETDAYRALSERPEITCVPGMRSRRG
jgi:hypothetical protein